MSTINSDEHDAEHGMRSGPEQPMATEQRDEPWASSSQQRTGKKQGRVCERSGMEESEASRSAAETNSLDRSSCQQRTLAIRIVSDCLSPPASHASCTFGALAPAPRPAPVLWTVSGKPTRQGDRAPLSVRSVKILVVFVRDEQFQSFFDERCSGKFIFMLRDK